VTVGIIVTVGVEGSREPEDIMTRKQFADKATKAFLKANPTAKIAYWIEIPKEVTYPTGVKEWRGKFFAIAPGYKKMYMIATGDDTYVMVR
jgi:hypothetical protein